MKNETKRGRRERRGGPPPIVSTCPHCQHGFISRFEAKRHICRLKEEHDAR